MNYKLEQYNVNSKSKEVYKEHQYYDVHKYSINIARSFDSKQDI